MEEYKDVEINGNKYRIDKLAPKAAEGSFILQQIITNRWMEVPESFAFVQRKLLSVCMIYNELGLVSAVQFDNNKDEPKIVPKCLQDDAGALYALTIQSFEFNLGPTLAGLKINTMTTDQPALALIR